MAIGEGQSLRTHHALDEEGALTPEVRLVRLLLLNQLLLVLHLTSIMIVICLQPRILPLFQVSLLTMNSNGPLLKGVPYLPALRIVPAFQITQPVLKSLPLLDIFAPLIDAPRHQIKIALTLDALAEGEKPAEGSFDGFAVFFVVIINNLADFFLGVAVFK